MAIVRIQLFQSGIRDLVSLPVCRARPCLVSSTRPAEIQACVISIDSMRFSNIDTIDVSISSFFTFRTMCSSLCDRNTRNGVMEMIEISFVS